MITNIAELVEYLDTKGLLPRVLNISVGDVSISMRSSMGPADPKDTPESIQPPEHSMAELMRKPEPPTLPELIQKGIIKT